MKTELTPEQTDLLTRINWLSIHGHKHTAAWLLGEYWKLYPKMK